MKMISPYVTSFQRDGITAIRSGCRATVRGLYQGFKWVARTGRGIAHAMGQK
jgi:hypothetical protein